MEQRFHNVGYISAQVLHRSRGLMMSVQSREAVEYWRHYLDRAEANATKPDVPKGRFTP